MNSILKKYNINFITRTIHGRLFKFCESPDQNIQKLLGEWISSFREIDELNDHLVIIDEILTGSRGPLQGGTDICIAIHLTSDKCYLFDFIDYPPDFNNPDFALPTVDYRDILIEWKSFLQKKSED